MYRVYSNDSMIKIILHSSRPSKQMLNFHIKKNTYIYKYPLIYIKISDFGLGIKH